MAVGDMAVWWDLIFRLIVHRSLKHAIGHSGHRSLIPPVSESMHLID